MPYEIKQAIRQYANTQIKPAMRYEKIQKMIKKYEHIVAPSNYKRPKAIFTKKMLEVIIIKKTTLQESDLFRHYLCDLNVNCL